MASVQVYQALTLKIFHTCPMKSPLYTKLLPEKNLLVLMKKSYIHWQYLCFFITVQKQVSFLLYLYLYNIYLSRTIADLPTLISKIEYHDKWIINWEAINSAHAVCAGGGVSKGGCAPLCPRKIHFVY